MASNNNDSISMAVFCDFENVALGVRDAQYEQFDIRPVLERLLVKGSIVVKKAYCDWERYKGFKNAMHEANFELIEIPHVRQSGKNSADIRLVVDALDLCYTKSHVDTFVIVSGDSDFSPLVSKLRENAKQVIGVGVKKSTSDLLIANCDEFIFYDDLVREQARRSSRQGNREASPGKRSPEDARPRREDLETRRAQALEIAMETYDALSSERGDGSKLWASVLKDAIKRRKPDFNESYYGFRAFGNLLDEAQARGLLRVGRDERSGTYVYRDGAASAADTPPPVRDTAETTVASKAAAQQAPEDSQQESGTADPKNLSKRKKRNERQAHGKQSRSRQETTVEQETAEAPATPAPVAKLAAPEPVAIDAVSKPSSPEAEATDTPAPKPARQPRRRSKTVAKEAQPATSVETAVESPRHSPAKPSAPADAAANSAAAASPAAPDTTPASPARKSPRRKAKPAGETPKS